MQIIIKYAIELSSKDKSKIEDYFANKYGEVSFCYVLDKSLIGGFVAVCDDQIFDASIKNKLQALKLALK